MRNRRRSLHTALSVRILRAFVSSCSLIYTNFDESFYLPRPDTAGTPTKPRFLVWIGVGRNSELWQKCTNRFWIYEKVGDFVFVSQNLAIKLHFACTRTFTIQIPCFSPHFTLKLISCQLFCRCWIKICTRLCLAMNKWKSIHEAAFVYVYRTCKRKMFT